MGEFFIVSPGSGSPLHLPGSGMLHDDDGAADDGAADASDVLVISDIVFFMRGEASELEF
jgi:hypothetical protein